MNVVKKLLLGLLGVIIFALVALAILIATINPNDYKPQITDQVKQHTGRDLDLVNIELTLFPNFGLSLQQATLSNAQGFGEKPFVKVEQVDLSVAIMPLLEERLEIDTLTLHGLELNLAKNETGLTNWQDLMSQTPNKDEASTQAAPKKEDLFAQLESLNFGGLDIRNGTIHWQDQQNAQDISLTNVTLRTSAITFNQFFEVELSANSKIKQPQLDNQLAVTGQVKLAPQGLIEVKDLIKTTDTRSQSLPVSHITTQAKLSTLSFHLGDLHLKLPTFQLDYSISGQKDFQLSQLDGNVTLENVDLNLTKQRINIAQLQSQYNAIGSQSIPLESANGEITLPSIAFNLDSQKLTTGVLKLSSTANLPELLSKPVSLSLSTQPELDLGNDRAALKALNLKVLDVTTKGHATVQQLTSAPQINSHINVSSFNLRQLLTTLGMEIEAINTMSDTKTLTKVALIADTQVNLETQAVSSKNIKITVDDSQLTGQTSVKNFSTPAISYKLALNKVNVSRYLPPKPKQPEATPPAAPAKDFDIPIPVDTVKSLNINGSFKAGKIQYDKLALTQLTTQLKVKDGLVQLKPVKAKLFKSPVTLNATLDVRGKQPKYRISTDAKGVPVGKVLKAFTDNDRISGNGSIKANLVSSGNKLSLIKKGLNGMLNANLKNGAVKGFNLAQTIRQAKAKVTGEKAAGSPDELQTDFSSLIANTTIKNGVVTMKKLSAQAPYMRINGSGTVSLPKESLNMLVKTKIVGSDKGQGGKELKDLNGLTIPVKLKDKWTSPDISLDLESVLEQKTKQEIQKKIDGKKKAVQKELDKQKKDIGKNLEKELQQNLLKGLPF